MCVKTPTTVGATVKKLLSFALAAVAMTATAAAFADYGHDHDPAHSQVRRDSPLVQEVNAANERFKNINVALADGWVQATPCVSGPDFGAMGVHFVHQDRISQALLDPKQPEALIYEPLEDGSFRLVGVEFIILASLWNSNNGPPALEGNLLNFVNEPNRFGLPAFYELHVWAFQDNPNGSFADWNSRVVCDKQPIK
jgi:hypothetical protein